MPRKDADYLWRLLGTGLGFALLFGGGAVTALTIFAALRIFTASGERRVAYVQKMIHLQFRFYIWLLQQLRVIDLDIEGREKLNGGTGCMIIANHPTLLDVVLLMALVPRAQCIVKSELWENRYLGGVVRSAGYIRNDLPPEELLAACDAALQQGKSLIIFPEGTRSRPGEALRFRRGFANIATLLDADIQLVTITCNPPTLLKGEKWWVIPPRRPRFRLMAGERMTPEAWGGHEYRSLATRKLVRHLEDYYSEQLANG